MSIVFDDLKQSSATMPVGPAREFVYDDLRQGIELSTENQFYTSIQPKIWSGNSQHALSDLNYGQARAVITSRTFNDVNQLSPAVFIESDDIPYDPMMLDDVSNFGSDGALEPFALRDKLARTSINIPYEPNEVKGAILSGNFDSYGRTNLIAFKFPLETSTFSPFIEGIDDESDFAESIQLPGYTTDKFYDTKPFDDLTQDSLINDVLPNERFTPTGYAYYDASINIQGLDSIAYVGLTNR